MSLVGTLVVRVLAEGTEKASGQVQSFGDAVAGVGRNMTAFVTAPLLGLGAALLSVASDAEEASAKFDVVFGSLGRGVRDALGDFAAETNRSSVELEAMAARFGDLLKPLGFVGEEMSGLSVEMVKLATDLSSFNNMPMDEALRRLQGTLVGSHENALAFGVVINENTLKAEMAAQGTDRLTGAQFEQAKVQARINLLMRGTTDAQGDAARTSESFANQTRGLMAALRDTGVAIAQSGLLEFATKIVKQGAAWVRSFAQLNPEILKWGTIIAGVVAAVGPLLLILGKIIAIAPAVGTAFTVMTGPVGAIIAGIAALVAGVVLLVKNWDAVVAFMTQRFPGATSAFTRLWDTIKTKVGAAIKTVKDLWKRFGDDIIGGIKFIADVWMRQVNFIIDVLDFWISTIADVVGFIVAVFQGDIPAALQSLANIFNRVWVVIGDIVISAFQRLLAAAAGIAIVFGQGELAKSITGFQQNLEDLRPKIEDVADEIGEVKKVARTAKPEIDKAAGAVGALEMAASSAAGALGGEGGLRKELERLDDLEVAPTLGVTFPQADRVTLDDVMGKLRGIPDGSPYEATADVKVTPAATKALDDLFEKISADGPGSLKHAIATDLVGAFGLAFETGIPGQIGSFIDGALNSLITALADDLVNAVIGEGGVEGAFKSFFGEGGTMASLLGEGGVALGIIGGFIALATVAFEQFFGIDLPGLVSDALDEILPGGGESTGDTDDLLSELISEGGFDTPEAFIASVQSNNNLKQFLINLFGSWTAFVAAVFAAFDEELPTGGPPEEDMPELPPPPPGMMASVIGSVVSSMPGIGGFPVATASPAMPSTMSAAPAGLSSAAVNVFIGTDQLEPYLVEVLEGGP